MIDAILGGRHRAAEQPAVGAPPRVDGIYRGQVRVPRARPARPGVGSGAGRRGTRPGLHPVRLVLRLAQLGVALGLLVAGVLVAGYALGHVVAPALVLR